MARPCSACFPTAHLKMTKSMNPELNFLQPIRTCSDGVWSRPALRTAVALGLAQPGDDLSLTTDFEPLHDEAFEVAPKHFHEDFTRWSQGLKPCHEKNRVGLDAIVAELTDLGFAPSDESLSVRDRQLGIAGEMDAIGHIEGLVTFVEIKVLPYLPNRVRAADAVQLLLYAIARNADGNRDEELHLAVYMLAHAPFTVVAHFIPTPGRLETFAYLAITN